MKRAPGDPKNANRMGCDIYLGSRSLNENQLLLKTCFKVFCCENLHNTTSKVHIVPHFGVMFQSHLRSKVNISGELGGIGSFYSCSMSHATSLGGDGVHCLDV